MLLAVALAGCGSAIPRAPAPEPPPAAVPEEHAAASACPEIASEARPTLSTICGRAAAAYSRGDDCAALQSLRVLDGDPGAIVFDVENPQAYFAAISRLRAEVERRVARGPVTMRSTGHEAPASPEAVREWIVGLEDVSMARSRHHQQVAEAPVVRALVRAGDSAVPALIDALERDMRLTRTVMPWACDGPPQLLFVRTLAHEALVEILHVDLAPRLFAAHHEREGDWWAQLAAAYRSHWATMEPESPARRRYLLLADDRAGSEAWAAASEGALEGEDDAYGLLLRRARETLPDHPHDACTIADAAWRLEPRAAPPMVAFARDCLARRSCPCSSRLVDTLAPEEPSILEALETYRPRAEIGHDLALLVRHRAHPAAQRLLARLFAPQGPHGETWREGPGDLAWASTPGVLELEPVRAMLRRALQDQTPFGVLATRGGEAWLSYGARGHVVAVAVLPAVPRDVRRCDAYASALSRHLGIALDLSSPIAHRDEAIARMLAALDR